MKAVDSLVKIIDRKSKLLGMDAPVKVVDKTPVKPPIDPQQGIDILKRWANLTPKNIQGTETE